MEFEIRYKEILLIVGQISISIFSEEVEVAEVINALYNAFEYLGLHHMEEQSEGWEW